MKTHSDHAHHYLVTNPENGIQHGRCKTCGFERDFEPFKDEAKTINYYNGRHSRLTGTYQ